MHRDQTTLPPRQREGLLPGQRAAPPGTVDFTSMFILHQAFRRGLARFRALTEADAAPAGLRRAAKRWGLFTEAVTHHHEGEDRGLWPALEDVAAPEEVGVLRQMAAEHQSLHEALDDCTAAVQALRTSVWAAGCFHAHALFVLLARVLEAHFAHEEEAALAIAQRYLRQEDWLRIEREQSKRADRRGCCSRWCPGCSMACPGESGALFSPTGHLGPHWSGTHGRFERRERELFGRYADLLPSESPAVVPARSEHADAILAWMQQSPFSRGWVRRPVNRRMCSPTGCATRTRVVGSSRTTESPWGMARSGTTPRRGRLNWHTSSSNRHGADAV